MRALNLAGQRFGRWTVTDQMRSTPDPQQTRRRQWFCTCDCGNQAWVSTEHLRQGHSRSCGCFRRDQSRVQDAGLRRKYVAIQGMAKKRGYAFELSLEQVREIITRDCSYCGEPPNNVIASNKGYDPLLCHGIDRLDNSLGYIEGNCIPACRLCNHMKNTLTTTQFYDHMMKIISRGSYAKEARTATAAAQAPTRGSPHS